MNDNIRIELEALKIEAQKNMIGGDVDSVLDCIRAMKDEPQGEFTEEDIEKAWRAGYESRAIENKVPKRIEEFITKLREEK